MNDIKNKEEDNSELEDFLALLEQAEEILAQKEKIEEILERLEFASRAA